MDLEYIIEKTELEEKEKQQQPSSHYDDEEEGMGPSCSGLTVLEEMTRIPNRKARKNKKIQGLEALFGECKMTDCAEKKQTQARRIKRRI